MKRDSCSRLSSWESGFSEVQNLCVSKEFAVSLIRRSVASNYFQHITDLAQACQSFSSESVKGQLIKVFEDVAFTARISLASKFQISKRDTTSIIRDLDLQIWNIYSQCDVRSSGVNAVQNKFFHALSQVSYCHSRPKERSHFFL